MNILNKFKIQPNQLYTITSDNGANMLKSINLIEKEISDAEIPESEINNDVTEIIEDDIADPDSYDDVHSILSDCDINNR